MDDAVAGLTLSILILVQCVVDEYWELEAAISPENLGAAELNGSDCGFAVGLGRRLKCLHKALCKRGW